MSTNNSYYDNLDFRINTLYDAVYNDENKWQYNVKPIIKNNIELIDIKEPDYFDPSHIFNNQIKFISKIHDKWTFKRTSDESYPCTISIGLYEQMGNYNDLGRSELYNPAIHYILSESVIAENFKHALLPVMFFDITLEKLKSYSKNMYETIKSDIKDDKNLLQDDKTLLYVFITEHYFKIETVEEFIKNECKNMTLLHWKVLIFQVLFSLYKISEKIQKFRHNQLDLKSVKIYRKKENNKPVTYKVGSTEFQVPNVGFEIKITDFDSSYAGDYIKNKHIAGVTDNPYYDIHYFISSIYISIMKHNGECSKELKEFIDELIPKKFLPNHNENFTGLNEMEFDNYSSQIIVPAIVLRKNNFFTKFIKTNNMELSVSPIENDKIQIKKVSKREKDVNYLSPTDDISDEYRMLGRNISNKKKSQYSNNKDMITGSRKVVVPGFNNDSEISETGIFDKAEKYINRNKKLSDEETFNLSESLAGSDHNDTEIYNAIKELQRAKKSKKAKKVKKAKKDESSESEKKPKKSSKKHRKQKRETDDDSSSSSESSHVPQKKESSHTGGSSESKDSDNSEKANVNKNLKKIDSKFAKSLKNLPSSFVGEVPSHILNSLPSLGGDTENGLMMSQGMPQMPPGMDPGMMQMMNQQGPMGMPPQGMPPGMPLGMQQGMPLGMQQGMPPGMQQGMPPGMQQGMPPGMPPGMMDPSMMNPSMMQSSNPIMQNMPNFPMNGQPPMMGGGKTDLQYGFIKNGKFVDDFFF